MDRDHEDFACWAESLRDKYPNRTDAYNFARDAWQEANARLIASAPELLELVIRANHGTKGAHTVAWQETARAVIARATGESHGQR